MMAATPTTEDMVRYLWRKLHRMEGELAEAREALEGLLSTSLMWPEEENAARAALARDDVEYWGEHLQGCQCEGCKH